MKVANGVKQIGAFCLSLLFFLLVLRGCTPVQAQTQIGSRLNNLEVSVSSLRSQINRLESQISKQGRPTARASSAPSAEPKLGRVYSSDPMFDRLATLVIELKERINEVEARLSKLESQVPSKTNS